MKYKIPTPRMPSDEELRAYSLKYLRDGRIEEMEIVY